MYDEESLAAVRRRQGRLRPGQPPQPRQPGRPRPARRRRSARSGPAAVRSALRLVHDGGSLGDAVHRCTGVGKCVAAPRPVASCARPTSPPATRRTPPAAGRGSCRRPSTDRSSQGLADPAVGEALDLCLACKGCASDCPTGVDMATYKAEVLHQKHDVQGVRRPRTPLPARPAARRWADRAAPVAPLANRMLRLGPARAWPGPTAGVDARRSIPAFARTTLRRSVPTSGDVPDVWIWADSFSDHFFPGQRPRRDPLPRVGRSHRPGDPGRRVLRSDLDHHRAARRGPRDHGAHGADAPAVRRVRRPGHRARALLPGHAAQRRRRVLTRARRPRCSAWPS